MSAPPAKERRARLAAIASGGAVAPHRPGATWNRWLRRARGEWRRLLRRDGVWLLVFVLVATWALTPSRPWSRSGELEVGTVAARDYVATRDDLVLDRQATLDKQRRARDEVLPVYDFDPAASTRLAAELERLFALGAGAGADDEEELMQRLQRERVALRVTPQQLATLRRERFSLELLDRLRATADSILGRGVVAGKNLLLEHRSRGIRLRDLAAGTERPQLDLYDYLDYPDGVRQVAAIEVRSWSDYSAEDRGHLLELQLANLSPNLHLNQSETTRRRESAEAGVEPVYNRVRRGQVIVRQGDQIDAQAASVLADLSRSGRRGARLLAVFGTLLLVAAVGLVVWLGVRRERVAAPRRRTAIAELLLLLLAALLGARLCYLLATGLAGAFDQPPFDQARAYFFAIPFAALALVVVLLYGRGVALLLALSYSLLAGFLLEDPSWGPALYAMAGSLAAVLTVDHYQLKQRSLLVRAGGVVGLVSVGAVLVLAATGGEVDGTTLLLQLACALAGGMLTAAVASFAITVCESLFGLTTGIKLVELANTNLPLLRRLAFEAPGTFQHSLMVANLAKAGCEEIGADSVLAYTAALYHDLGKVFRPEYFVENQRAGQNRHDKLLPSMSALILVNHVKDGLALAREHHLPEPILDAIAEHHGTRLITYFFSKAREMHDPQAGELPADNFRYPGPRPRSRVTGVLMLADGVEAACRSLEDPSPARIRAVVKAITDDCLRDGQLDDTDLTLGDLNRMGEAFQRLLAHIHHRRLDYPGFDFNARRERGKVVAGPGARQGEATGDAGARAAAESTLARQA